MRFGLVRNLLPLLLLVLMLAGCFTSQQERVQLLNEDGVYLFERGQYEAARQNFELALRLQPESDALLFNLGQCQDRLGREKEAERLYQQALERNANNGPCRHALALLMYRQGRRKEAEEIIQGWLTEQPELAWAYAAEGWRLRQDGDLLQAQVRLQQALERDPNNVAALIELGIVYELLERPDRALALYEKARTRAPQRDDLAHRINLLVSRGVKKPLPD